MDSANTDNTELNHPLSSWNGQPINASLFLREIGEYAARKGFLTLLLQGYFVSKNVIVCASADAAQAVKLFHLDPVLNPMPNQPLDVLNPPDPPIEATRNATYALTADDKKLYVASPELFNHASQQHCSDIISRINNPDVARRVRNASLGDVRRALIEISHIRGELTNAHITHHLMKISAHAKQGISTIDPFAFSKWKNMHQNMLFMLPITHRLPDTYIAENYRHQSKTDFINRVFQRMIFAVYIFKG